jgi:hypothetical protein
MNGLQFYLEHDVPVVNGHTIYIDAPWALTSVSQRQFWHTDPMAKIRGWAVRRDSLSRHLGLECCGDFVWQACHAVHGGGNQE